MGLKMKSILYARVSSKEQEKEGYSIPAQLKLLKEYANRRGFEVVKEFIDVETAKTGKTYSAKTWVIATGSSPSAPPIEGLDKTPYITNKEIFSLDHLPESMLVLGAGPIATEMSQAFCRLGTKVYVIQRSGQILSKEDKDMADILMDALR